MDDEKSKGRKAKSGMNAILPQGGRTTTGRNRPRPKPPKPA